MTANCLRLKNILIDRDGTLIEERQYLGDPDGVALIPGAAAGLKELSDAGCRLFLVTNQSGIGRGYFGMDGFLAVQRRIDELLERSSIFLADQAFCPHAPEERCPCRKPATGMWERLRERHGLRPEESAMIGDKPEDISFGRRAGLAVTILVLTGHGRRSAERLGIDASGQPLFFPEQDSPDQPHVVAADLGTASRWLLGQTARQ
jgi:D-glycero-D-manno-heptose 1,7-bisphosphate phosphatase